MTTQKQVLANQENADKSTGPVTEEGKGVVSQNATKHGILSKEVVLPTESREEYQTVRQKFIDDLKPQGAVEQVLVDKIVIYHWRLQRVLVAEQGAIRQRLDNYSYKRILARGKEADRYDKFPAIIDYRNERLRNSYSCARTITILNGMIKTVEEMGYLPEQPKMKYATMNNLSFDEERLAMFLFLNEVAQGKIETEPKEKGKKGLLFILNKDIDFIKVARDASEEVEASEDETGQMMAHVPPAGDIDVLGRYEVSLERSFYRALNELTKLQVLRKGGKVFTAKSVELEGISQE